MSPRKASKWKDRFDLDFAFLQHNKKPTGSAFRWVRENCAISSQALLDALLPPTRTAPPGTSPVREYALSTKANLVIGYLRPDRRIISTRVGKSTRTTDVAEAFLPRRPE